MNSYRRQGPPLTDAELAAERKKWLRKRKAEARRALKAIREAGSRRKNPPRKRINVGKGR